MKHGRKHRKAYAAEAVLFAVSLGTWLWTGNPYLGMVVLATLVLLVQE